MGTKSDTVIKVHRVWLNCEKAILAVGYSFMALLCVTGMFDGGPFFVCLFGAIFSLSVGGAIIWASLQTLVITPKEIKTKIAWFTLRTIPVSEIQTIVYVSHYDHNQDYYVLSPKTQADIQNRGASVLYSDPYVRAKWERMGRKMEENVIKIRAYYYSRFRIGYMKKEEGIWLCTSTKNIEKIRNACFHAAYVTTW